MRAGTAERSRLAVTRLNLTNFRSYAAGALAVSGTSVVLAGPNGAGKTNVLDAISLLSPGRGLRGAKLAEHTRKGPVASEETLWAVAATVTRGGTEHPGVAVIVEEKSWVRELFEYICTAGGYAEPDVLAGQLTLLHEGSIVARTAGAQSDASALARRTAEVLLTPDDRMAR